MNLDRVSKCRDCGCVPPPTETHFVELKLGSLVPTKSGQPRKRGVAEFGFLLCGDCVTPFLGSLMPKKLEARP